MVVHAINPSTWEERLEASLVYMLSKFQDSQGLVETLSQNRTKNPKGLEDATEGLRSHHSHIHTIPLCIRFLH